MRKLLYVVLGLAIVLTAIFYSTKLYLKHKYALYDYPTVCYNEVGEWICPTDEGYGSLN
jgi:hypothetical protein